MNHSAPGLSALVPTRRGGSLSRRLVAITLLPMLAILSWAGYSTNSRFREANQARTIGQHIRALNRLIAARDALDAERLPTQAKMAIESYGVPAAFGSMVLGFDPSTRIEEVRPALLAQLPTDALRDRVVALRQMADQQQRIAPGELFTQNFERVLDEFESIDAELQRLSRRELQNIRGALSTTNDPERLGNAIRALVASQDLSNQLGDQTSTLFEFDSSPGENRAKRRALAASEALAVVQMDIVASNGGPETLESLKRLLGAEVTRSSAAKIEASLLSPPKPIDPTKFDVKNLQGLAKRFTALLVRAELSREVLAAATTEARLSAERAERSTRQLLRLNIALATTLALFSVLIALAFARSISRPLMALADRADHIRRGKLHLSQVSSSGPREVARVGDAMNDLVANLVVLERQASSLAAGDLTNPVLDEYLPGELGRSMQQTVGRLRSSIEKREELQERLGHQATHDELTGLPNRKALVSGVESALKRSRRAESGLAVLFIDLDGFKRANDLYGHGFGDGLLIASAQRLVTQLRGGDFAARIGGDEFVVLAENVEDPAHAVTIADRYIAALSSPIAIDNNTVKVGASVGIAVDFDGTATPDSLLRDADAAVYRAKAQGRGRAELFDEALRNQIERRNDIEQSILDAIKNKELRLEYQPIVEVTSSTDQAVATSMRSVEALIRWDRPGEGLVPPNDFIPHLESSPRIVDVGAWVLCEATREAHSWTGDAGKLTVSINISTRHLVAPSFVADVEHALHESGIDPKRVVLEITETSLVENVLVAIEHLYKVRSFGVRIAVDDFGTGFSSIRHLTDFPIDVLKIDRSFVSGVNSESRRGIVEMMIGVGRSLGLHLIAEGVETKEQGQALVELGCSQHQGFFHYRPMSADALLARFRSSIEN